MPTLNAFFQRYHDRGLEIIGISVDFKSDIAKVPAAAKSLAYPVALLGAITDNGFGPPEGFRSHTSSTSTVWCETNSLPLPTSCFTTSSYQCCRIEGVPRCPPKVVHERLSILPGSGSWHRFARVDRSSGVARRLGHRYHHYLPRLEPSSPTA
jgi:hypothetical protein